LSRSLLLERHPAREVKPIGTKLKPSEPAITRKTQYVAESYMIAIARGVPRVTADTGTLDVEVPPI